MPPQGSWSQAVSTKPRLVKDEVSKARVAAPANPWSVSQVLGPHVSASWHGVPVMPRECGCSPGRHPAKEPRSARSQALSSAHGAGPACPALAPGPFDTVVMVLSW